MDKTLIVVYIHTMECYSKIERNKLLIHTEAINMKINIVIEKIHKQRVHIRWSKLGTILEKTKL